MERSDERRRLFSSEDEFSAIVVEVVSPRVEISPASAWFLVFVAAFLGLLADILFNGAGLGLNLPIFVAAAIAALYLASHKLRTTLQMHRLMLLGAALAASAMIAWRDSDVLLALNLMASAGLMLVGLAMPAGVGVRRMGPITLSLALAAGVVSLGSAVWRLVFLVSWPAQLGTMWQKEAPVAGRALFVALPILATFGGLFYAADAVFAAEVERAVSIDLGRLRGHVLWTIAGLWLAASLLWSGLVVKPVNDVIADLPEQRRFEALATGIVLVPLVVLFALFVVVQVRYLFGGEDLVQRSIHLTYAQYARRGFFELVVASLLLLPVLTGIDWARRRDRASYALFLPFATALVVLLFVVMASAWQRLSIYRDTFGLTELRFYAAAVLPWLGVAFLLFLAGVALRGREQFFTVAIAAAFVLLLVLNIISPDAFIVRTNAERVAAGHSFDARYATSLSADAVPILVSRLDEIPPPERCQVAQALLDAWSGGSEGWRAWNFARSEARRLVAKNESRLSLACRENVRTDLAEFLNAERAI
jgi:hypothetical protein